MTETIANTNEKNLVAELIEAKVALAKTEMQLEWQKAEQVKKTILNRSQSLWLHCLRLWPRLKLSSSL